MSWLLLLLSPFINPISHLNVESLDSAFDYILDNMMVSASGSKIGGLQNNRLRGFKVGHFEFISPFNRDNDIFLEYVAAEEHQCDVNEIDFFDLTAFKGCKQVLTGRSDFHTLSAGRIPVLNVAENLIRMSGAICRAEHAAKSELGANYNTDLGEKSGTLTTIGHTVFNSESLFLRQINTANLTKRDVSSNLSLANHPCYFECSLSDLQSIAGRDGRFIGKIQRTNEKEDSNNSEDNSPESVSSHALGVIRHSLLRYQIRSRPEHFDFFAIAIAAIGGSVATYGVFYAKKNGLRIAYIGLAIGILIPILITIYAS